MNEERFRFRPLVSADRGDVLAISAKIWDGDDYVPSSFDAWISDPDGVFNGCFLGDRLVGFGRVGFVAPGHAWLEGLRKDPDAGVSGVGRALCLEGLRFLSGMDGLRSIRFSAYAHNPETIALNEAIGFRRTRTLSIKSKRIPGGSDGKEPFGRSLAEYHIDPADASSRVQVRMAADRAAILARLEAAGWFTDFRIESWKAYPVEGIELIMPGDLVFEAWSPDGRRTGCLVGSVDPLKRQANVAAFDADDESTALALFAAFEKAVVDAGYRYIEAVAARKGSSLATLDACGYVSWESEDDFLLYELPLDRLGSLPGQGSIAHG